MEGFRIIILTLLHYLRFPDSSVPADHMVEKIRAIQHEVKEKIEQSNAKIRMMMIDTGGRRCLKRETW